MTPRTASHEIDFKPLGGFVMLFVTLLEFVGAVFLGILSGSDPAGASLALAVAAILLGIWGFIGFGGFFIVEPNASRVLILFGRYRGTVRSPGFWWTNPFTKKRPVSLRARNLNGQKLKVNDLLGNPIEIAAVVVWQVHDTAQAVFDVEEFEHYVEVQSESAVRQLASTHPYDAGQAQGVSTTLRGSSAEVAQELAAELAERLGRAGVEIVEARLSHLAYAQEIASSMLQLQQASAVIAARAKIVEGAVGMVEHALQLLAEKKVVELDPERRATMVNNLLVVLCGHGAPQPILNTGTLYT
jgi:regulator of protease activity HflC (stomatin/prohibitin superfamily)